MGIQDREYNRSGGGGISGNPLMRLLMGDFTIGYLFGIKIRIHASLVILLAFNLLTAGVTGWQIALTSSVILFSVILLHEFGHCFAARAVGGRGDDVLLWPLGGLAFIQTPRRPWPSFVGTAGGPLTNLIICLICAILLRVIQGSWVLGNPLAPYIGSATGGWTKMSTTAAYYLWWIYSTSMALFLFNLLPIFPLDGGRILQCALWPKLGFYQSTNVACIVGMTAAGLIFLISLGNFFMMFLMGWLGYYCYQTRMNLRQLADEVWEEERYEGTNSWSAPPTRPRVRLPRLRLLSGGGQNKPLDDRFRLSNLNPFRLLKRRQERRKFEKLMGGDD